MSTLLRLHWLKHRTVLAALALALFAFHWVFTRLAPNPEQARLMQQMFQLMPPAMQDLFGAEISSVLNPVGFLAFGYSHPFTLALLSAWVIRVPCGALAGELGAGTMDLLASRPVSRGAIVGSALLVTLVGLAALLAAALGGTALGLESRPVNGVGPFTFSRVVLACGLMFAGFASLVLVISALRRSGGAAIGGATALIAGSFALDYVARAWQPLQWARPLSLFTYYSRTGTLQTDLPVADIVILSVVAVVAAVIAFLIFGRRDL